MSFYPPYKDQFAALTLHQRGLLKHIPDLEEIEGWLLLVEAVELFSLARQLTSKNPIVCEIGTWKGKSAYVFANAIKPQDGVLYCVDPFNGDGDSASIASYKKEIQKLNTSLQGNFEETMKRYNLRNHIVIIPMNSEEAHSHFPGNKIDLLFIDGNHQYEHVRKDYLMWESLIPSGGTIIIHDVKAVHIDGPQRVMNEFILKNPQK